jgi:hypothetical protein
MHQVVTNSCLVNIAKGDSCFEKQKDSCQENGPIDLWYCLALEGICSIRVFYGFVASGMGVYSVREATEAGVQHRSVASGHPPD